MKLPSIPGFDEAAFNKYLKNTGMLMAGKVGSLVVKMLVTIQIANYLGAFNNGILNTAIVYVFLFASVASLGLDQFIVKELHAFPKQRDVILGTAFRMKWVAGLSSIPIIFFTWQLFKLEDTPYEYILILSFIGLFQSFNVVDAYFQSEVKSKYIMQVQITSTVVSATIKLIFIYLKCPLIWFVYASILDYVWLAMGYFIVYERKGRSLFLWRYDRVLAFRLFSFSWPLIISGIMGVLYMKIDQLMIHAMLGASEQGKYSTVVNFSEALYFIPGIIVASLFPAILNAKRDDPERYQKRLQNLYDIMVWMSLIFAISITVLSPWIYKLFKPEYASAAPVLSVHVWAGVFVFLGAASSQYLIAENLSRLTFYRTGIGALVNILLNIILIPGFGIMGAALATLAAYFSSAFFILFIPKLRQQGIMMLKSLFLVTTFQKIFKF